MKIAKVEFLEIRASRRSTWSFVEVATEEGLTGVGETTIHRDAHRMEGCVSRLAKGLEQAKDARGYLDAIPDPDDFADVTARSGLSQALTDIAGQRLGQPIWSLHTKAPAASLPVYANINRRTSDRTPEGFANSARQAVANGINALKIAPFDGVEPAMALSEAAPLLDHAFARIFAVRDAIGEGQLMVDCHWRLNMETFGLALDVAERAKLFWIECPFSEEPDWLDAIRAARSRANARGIRLAGLELKLWEDGFKPFLERECYDVLMPDIKHVGGYERFYKLADWAGRSGVQVAPHNPTGPISHAHSVMASSAIGNFLILEMQFDETEAFRNIVEGDLPMPVAGTVGRVDAPGLGLRLCRARFAEAAEGQAR